MGGESGAARRASPDDLVTRGLRPPGLITVDGAPDLEKALAALRPAVPARRCTVHQHRNLPAHAPDKPREEISADCQDMVHAAAAKGIGQRRKALSREWRLECRAAADSLGEAGGRLFTFTRPPISRWRSARTTDAIERLREEFERRIETRTVLPSAETAAVLFRAPLASGQVTTRKVDGWQTPAGPAAPLPIDLAA